MKRGLLLINLGTPSRAELSSVKSYLREFLTDKRVIDLPFLIRYLLVYCFIIPFRSKRSTSAYQAIWTKEGSPLLHHSKKLEKKVQHAVGLDYKVVLGMRYGECSIVSALDQLKTCTSITIVPLYPQYSSAANGSSIAEAMRYISTWEQIPSVTVIRDFFQHPDYIKAQAQIIKQYQKEPTHILFSYHGIPERQITKHQCPSICLESCPVLSKDEQGCYRAQCYQNSRLLAEELQLSEQDYSTAFQSRLGKAPWIKPYLDSKLQDLIAKGIKKLTIVCPSFVTDCLETLEEITLRTKQQWLELGGEELIVIPAMNEDPAWVNALVKICTV